MRHAASWAALALVGCARLPEIGAGECGNGVIEPPEDCDSFGIDGGSECRPKGAVGECHLDCTPGGDGVRPECPAGWGCDSAGICRKPTGEFEQLREYEVGSATALLAGDFDGDGRADIASLEAPDLIGFTLARFHYGSTGAELRESREFSRPLIPTVSDLSGDGRSDVVFADGRVGVLLGRADRSWVPETFSSYRVEDTSIRTLGVHDDPIQGAPGFIVLATFNGVHGVYSPDAANAGVPRLLGELWGPNETLVGDPVSGHLLEDVQASPCAQAVLAVRGESRFWVLDTCTRDASSGEPAWRQELSRTSIALDPPDAIDAAPKLVDLNADGHLDVLIGANGRVFAAKGDGTALSTATPYRVLVPAVDANPIDIEMPLAVGDLTGDGGVELMFDDHALFSRRPPGGTEYAYVSSLVAEPGHWTVAAIADFNGNGNADLVAASLARAGIDFFNGSGTDDFTTFRITTSRPVQHLAAGDFDGDYIVDLALSQVGAQTAQADSVLIAFGNTAGPPQPPTGVARLPAIEQISVYREGSLDHMLFASSETRDDQRLGVLTLLSGGNDRIPVALYELTNFATDSSTDGSGALRAFGGRFTRTDVSDVLAIGAPSGRPLADPMEFWLLPELATTDGTPILLEGGLPPNLRAVSGSGVTTTVHLSASVADVDADGRDELVLALPTEDGAQCGLVVLGVERDHVVLRTSLLAPEPCLSSQLQVVDADSDRQLDIALLAGGDGWTDARLSVFWNDGAGGFEVERRSLVAGPADPPVAFALFERTPARDTSFFYATRTELHIVTRAEASRDFPETRAPAPLAGCTGMAALDLDGDGAKDLALATSGNLSVLRALLENL